MTFSSEDADNVSIPNAMHAVMYEFYDDMLYVLGIAPSEERAFYQEKRAVVETLREINRWSEEFFQGRFGKEIWPLLIQEVDLGVRAADGVQRKF